MAISPRSSLIALAVVVTVLGATALSAAPHYYRGYSTANHGYYGPWYNRDKGYIKYNYYYRPHPGASYKYHYCYYYPRGKYSGYYYYYNTTSGKYWGRCKPGSTNYEYLDPKNQRGRLEDINVAWFEPQGAMRPVPQMNPRTTMIGPPQPEPPDPG